MSDTKTSQLPAPMRVVRRWLFRERAARGPGAIELDVVERQIDRECAAVRAEADAADGIEQGLQEARVALQSALTDPATPGIVDAEESRAIAQRLIGISVSAHHHTERLEALT